MSKGNFIPDLEGRVALVVGGSRGIGAAVARAMVDVGAKVVVTGRRRELLDDLEASFPSASAIRTIAGDMADGQAMEDAVDLAVSSFGRLDCAFNNAGGGHAPGRLHELPASVFAGALDHNLTGVFLAMKAQIRAMLDCGGGSIVNNSSTAGLVGVPHMAGYVAAKHGLAGLTKAAALEYAQDNIRCNLIAPGPVLTDAIREAGMSDKQYQVWAGAPPMKRPATPDEMVGAVLWLASDASSYVTGTTIPVDGGYVVR
jgi:NAD(P)-dependent dehydrogenase (short-subunit alcohol dehydrogenase family)